MKVRALGGRMGWGAGFLPWAVPASQETEPHPSQDTCEVSTGEVLHCCRKQAHRH